MKYLMSLLFTLFSMNAFSGVPQRITVVGKYKSLANSVVVIASEGGGLVKVPKNAVVTKNAITGDRVVARVSLKDFLNLN